MHYGLCDNVGPTPVMPIDEKQFIKPTQVLLVFVLLLFSPLLIDFMPFVYFV